MDISNLYDLYRSTAGITTDTRQLREGMLYFALKGPNFNGNHFAQQALDKGAAACIIDEPGFEQKGCITVPDVLQSLQELARFHRRQCRFPFIGLTGSNGKTTTKELIAATLSPSYKVGYTKGNLNNHIGVALTLLNLPEDTEIAVIEMGANAQGEIAFLSEICQPDIGLITNYGKAHLEGFGGVEGIIKGKSELYDHLRANDKMAWVNGDDPLQVEKSAGLQRKFFGEYPKADIRVERVLANNELGLIAVRVANTTVQTQLTGNYNFGNIAAAASLALYFGLSPKEIKAGLEAYRPSNHRSQIEKTERNLLIKDFYNANPSSMAAALENLQSLKHPNKWLVLGDMFELGCDSDTEHQATVSQLQKLHLEKIILVGSAFGKCRAPDTVQLPDTAAALDYLRSTAPHNKLILLKGSRGMALEKLLEVL